MKITVFTPTFNRGYIIESLFKSLQNQTFTNFEWLVIDDGSTDNTQSLFEKWIKENIAFPIRYYKVDNGGKHRAINRATDIALGQLFFIVDSDDYLTDDALQNIIEWENSLVDKKSYCGIAGNRGKNRETHIGTSFIGDFIDATSLDRSKHNILGDKAEVFYTNILKKYKFLEIEGEKFITEATVWNLMAKDGYKIRWFNKTIYICDYLEDGLTNNLKNIFSENPKGTAYYIKQQIELLNYNFKGRLSNYNLYYNFVKKNMGIKQAAENLEITQTILFLAIFLYKCKKILINK